MRRPSVRARARRAESVIKSAARGEWCANAAVVLSWLVGRRVPFAAVWRRSDRCRVPVRGHPRSAVGSSLVRSRSETEGRSQKEEGRRGGQGAEYRSRVLCGSQERTSSSLLWWLWLVVWLVDGGGWRVEVSFVSLAGF